MSAPQTLPDLLARAAADFAGHPALGGPDGNAAPYSVLAATAAHFSRSLRALGVGREDRLGLVLHQDVGSAVTLISAMASCAAVALPRLAPAELDAVLPRLGLRALLAPESRSHHAVDAAARRGVPVLFRSFGPAGTIVICGEAAGPPAADRPATPGDVSVIMLTSGSTGTPRLVPRTHRNVLQSAVACDRQHPISTADRSIVFTPLHHSYANEQIARSLAAGARIDLAGDFEPAQLEALLRRLRPTWLALTPAGLEAWLRERPPQAPPVPGLRFVQVSGARFAVARKLAAAAALGVPVLDSYGSSEALSVAYESLAGGCPPDSSGEIVADVRIVGDDGAPLPPGVAGEIQVRGATVFPGYLDDPAATSLAFSPGGWFRTGDIGVLDPAGCLSLRGRSDDLINRGGVKIDPAEVEAVLLAHPAIADCAVFGLPQPLTGAEVAAVVVLAPGRTATSRDIRRWALDRLSPHKLPRRIAIADALPRTPTGKIRRAAVAALVGEMPSSGASDTLAQPATAAEPRDPA